MVDYFVFPSIELCTLDVLKRLFDVSDPFCVLCSLLVTDVLPDFFALVPHEELHQSKDEGYEAVQSHVLECEVDGSYKDAGGFNQIWQHHE